MSREALLNVLRQEQRAEREQYKEDAVVDFLKRNYHLFCYSLTPIKEAQKVLEQPCTANDILGYLGFGDRLSMEKASSTDVLKACYNMLGSQLWKRYLKLHEGKPDFTMFYVVSKSALIITDVQLTEALPGFKHTYQQYMWMSLSELPEGCTMFRWCSE